LNWGPPAVLLGKNSLQASLKEKKMETGIGEGKRSKWKEGSRGENSLTNGETPRVTGGEQTKGEVFQV